MPKAVLKILVSFALCLGLAMPTAQSAATQQKSYWGTALAAAVATYFIGKKASSRFKKAKQKIHQQPSGSGTKPTLSVKQFLLSRYFPRSFVLKASALVFGVFCLETCVQPNTQQKSQTPPQDVSDAPEATPGQSAPRTGEMPTKTQGTPQTAPRPNEDFFPEYDPSLFDFDAHLSPQTRGLVERITPQNPSTEVDDIDPVLLASIVFDDPMQGQDATQHASHHMPGPSSIQFIRVLQQTADRGFAECGYHATRNAILLAQNNDQDVRNSQAYENFFTQNQPQHADDFYANLLSAEDMFNIVRDTDQLSAAQKNTVVVLADRAHVLNETLDNSLGNLIDTCYEGSMEKCMINQLDAFQKALPGTRLVVIARARSEHWVALRCTKNADQSLTIEVADSGESKISHDEINDIVNTVTHKNISAAHTLTTN